MLGFDAKPSVHDELRAQSSDFSEEMVIECLEDVVVWPAATGSLGGAVDGEGEGDADGMDVDAGENSPEDEVARGHIMEGAIVESVISSAVKGASITL